MSVDRFHNFCGSYIKVLHARHTRRLQNCYDKNLSLLPDAKTVFLARPTTSRILLKQMIGRALRGPEAGGEALANIVSFQDYWERFTGVLEPEDVLEGQRYEFDEKTKKIRPLQSLVLDDGTQIPNDVTAHIHRMYSSMPIRFDVVRSRLAGWYTLDDRHVAVFEHQLEAVQTFLSEANMDLTGKSLLSYFDEVPDPILAQRDLADLRDFVRMNGEVPPFEEARDTSTPRDVAKRLVEKKSDMFEKSRLVEEAYGSQPCHGVYPSLDSFEAAVDREIRKLIRGHTKYDRTIPDPSASKGFLPLPYFDRNLRPIVYKVEDFILKKLDRRYHKPLNSLPPIRWSYRVVDSYYGVWVYRRSGRDAGTAHITINLLLSTNPQYVSDEVLEFVVYHEVLHHLLPFAGHDSTFAELEALWPDGDRIQAKLHTLGDEWDVRAEAYRDDDLRNRAHRRPVIGKRARDYSWL